jgi:iron(III) transport system permease protein
VRTVAIGTAAVIFAVCSILPVAYLVGTSLAGLDAAGATLLLDARQRTLLSNTTLLGVGVALLSTAIGAPLGITLARVPLRRKGAIRLVLAAPMLLPPYVVALAWIYLGAGASWTYSMPTAVVVLSLVFYPLCMLASEVGFRRIDGRLEEAALVVASPRRVLQQITLPLAAPLIGAAALVVFVLAVSEFGVPGLLRVRVYTTEVFTAFASLYDFSRAIVLAVPLLALSAGVGAVCAALLRDRIVSSRPLMGTHPALFDHWGRAARLAIVVVIVAAVLFPIVMLTREALNVRSLRASLAGSGEAIANSLILSVVGATIVTDVALGLGYARARARYRLANLADVLFVVLFAVPSTIVGVGLIGLWNRHGVFGAVYGTDAMFILAYLARFVPVAALILAAVVRYVPFSHEEAASAAGAGWLRTMWHIVLPQVRLGLAAAWIVVFVLSFGELGASVLVAPPGESTLPIRIYTIIANTPPGQVAALALLQAVIVFMPLAVLGTVVSLRPWVRAQGFLDVGERREGR